MKDGGFLLVNEGIPIDGLFIRMRTGLMMAMNGGFLLLIMVKITADMATNCRQASALLAMVDHHYESFNHHSQHEPFFSTNHL